MVYDDRPRDQRAIDQIRADAEEIAADAVKGAIIIEAIEDPENPFAIFLAELRKLAVSATTALMHVDLYNPEGIERARGLQREVVLFQNAISVVIQLLESGRLAQDAFNASEESAQAHIRRAMGDILVGHRREAGQPDT